MNIGERIAYFRKERKYSVNGLAMRSGVSQSYVRELELGQYDNPTIEVLESLCGALGISLSEFFDEHKDLRTTSDNLIEEIELLNPAQRDLLRQFLHILRTQPHEEPTTKDTTKESMIVKRHTK